METYIHFHLIWKDKHTANRFVSPRKIRSKYGSRFNPYPAMFI